MAHGFNHVLEEAPKAQIIAQIEELHARGHIDNVIAAGLKATVNALPGKLVAIAFNGSQEPSGFCYSSWNSHDDERDTLTDEERKLPNEPGYERDPVTGENVGEIHPEWEGKRDRAVAARILKSHGRAPKL